MLKKEYSKDLSKLNTFGLKVAARYYMEYDSVADLLDLDFEELAKPVKHIGGGSNLLFTGDFPGTILHSAVRFTELLSEDADTVTLSVGAGVVFDDFCQWCAEKGYWGVENLSLIPGEVGASAVQNIGAYGVEVKDVIKTVYCYDTVEEEMVHFSREECAYDYRDSFFKHADGRYIVTHVVFVLSKGYAPRLDYGHLREAVLADWGGDADASASVGVDCPQLTPMQVRQTIIKVRNEKLPRVGVVGSAGSFFKNPIVERSCYEKICSLVPGVNVPHYEVEDKVKIPAAWLIEQCGWKGKRSGNAGVWEKQALVLVNATGLALPEEIIRLENKIKLSVKERFGIELSPEVEHL
ncbi:MAG: UDP-N-acetylmuramate dehydrogenase [Bacteroidales bacterium]|nr:UDP-N-acetylmuramate dehydrogenase [Bacteroidales bacterium]